MFYSLVGYGGIIFMCWIVFLLIKYRKTTKMRTRKILFCYIVGIVSLFVSFVTIIVWQDIAIISSMTMWVGCFALAWALDKSKISFNKEVGNVSN